MKCFGLVLVFISGLLLAASSFTQTSTTQSLSYTIPTSSAWTDTGLDLHSGDVVEISASGASSSVPDRHAIAGQASCDPQGISGAAGSQDLPLPSVPAGALLARLHAQGAAPVLIGAHAELRIEEPGHLFLGANAGSTPACQGSFAVKVNLTTGQTPTAAAQASGEKALAPSSGSAGSTQQDQKPATMKQKLSTAAQIWLAGQLGTGAPGQPASAASSSAVAPGNANSSSSAGTSGNAAAATAVPALTVATAPLDAALRKDLDGLPRRVHDEYQNPGDMVNFVFIGPEKQVQSALEAANWHVADTNTKEAAVKAILQTYEKKDYLQMPMSKLMLFGRFQDYGYEQAEPIAMVASRHHFRIWKAPFTWDGQPVWVGAGTHDIGFEKDQRNGKVTHKIDPAVDGERDNIGASLQKAGKAKSLSYYLPPDPVQEANNATGGSYHSDGRILVVFLQEK
jgi:hypothetical protein